MNIQKDDYVIALNAKGKDMLVKALADSKGHVEAVVEKLCHMPGQRQTLTVDKKDLVLNLGPNPRRGKVYGVDTSNLYYTKKDHDVFGTVYFFYKPEKEVVKALWAAMDKTAATLKRFGLSFLLDQGTIWEVLPPSPTTKYAGCYMRSRKEEIPDRIQIIPEFMNPIDYSYVLCHELAHLLDMRFVTSNKIKGHWLRLFNTSIKVMAIKKETSTELLDGLLSQEDPPSAFKGQLGEEEALAFKWIIRTISQLHSITLSDLDTLFVADMRDDIKALWPTRAISVKELAPIVSEYATKNVKELFAEAVSMHITKRHKFPEPLIKLIEKTISHAKVQA